MFYPLNYRGTRASVGRSLPNHAGNLQVYAARSVSRGAG